MSGILGLLDTDLLYLEPGSKQKEIFRFLSAILGVGALRVIFKIARAPCLRFIHEACGQKPPEPFDAAQFWFLQESWTEMKGIGLNEEDTRYFRINMGSGPQAKVLWNEQDFQTERDWWRNPRGLASSQSLQSTSDDSITLVTSTGTAKTEPVEKGKDAVTVSITPTASSSPKLEPIEKTITISKDLPFVHAPGIFQSRAGEGLVQGTTIKWWMDRWQSEVLAVASIQGLAMQEACELLSYAYFGSDHGHKRHTLACLAVTAMVATTLATAMLTQWSWIPQFISLSLLGYFINWTASLRSWKWTPNPNLKTYRPRLLNAWPNTSQNAVHIRIAVQNARTCHLRALIPLDLPLAEKARRHACNARGRYFRNTRGVPASEKPYNDIHDMKMHWLSYQVEGSYYGLIASVEPDNALRRTLSILFSICVSSVLLVTGFGADVPKTLSPYILGIYALGFITAVSARGKSAKWTLSEYQALDLTTMEVPELVRERICQLGFVGRILGGGNGAGGGSKGGTLPV